MQKNLIFILYDSINNSVFQSQVFQPLTKLIEKNLHKQITIVSFEDFRLKNFKPPFHPKINFILARKLPFFGRFSFFYAQKQLEKIFKKLEYQKIIVRGPLAGFIALKTIKKLKIKTELIVQARGLCAEEFRFAIKYQNKTFLNKILQKIIYKSFFKIEQFVYGNKKQNLKIESVSVALKEYLIKIFKTNSQKIYIASNDLPEQINPEQIKNWKNEIRDKLKIPQNYKIYVYSGSMKPWQCAQESIKYFKDIYEKNKNVFLLILSQNKTEFEKEIEFQKISKNYYCVLNVKPNEVYKYLSACNYGIIFRDKDIINWVSRPTKILEYKSVGLEIIHNNSIGYLSNTF